MKIGIIGAGKVGTALAIIFARNGFNVLIASKHRGSANEAARISRAKSAEILDAAKADIVVLSVPDMEIVNAAKTIQPVVHKNRVVLHLSGSLPYDIIQFLNSYTGALHPLKSFADPINSAKTIKNTLFTFDGDNAAFDILLPLIKKIGCKLVRINSADKPLYHLAAVLTSNYTVTLFDISEHILRHIGFSKGEAKEALMSLLKGVIYNIETKDAKSALTGPILRGDSNTVKLHIQNITDENIKTIYKSLAFATLKIAEREGLSKDKIKKIREVLNG